MTPDVFAANQDQLRKGLDAAQVAATDFDQKWKGVRSEDLLHDGDGSGMGDGDRHDHQNLPTILSGHAGGLRTGRYVAKCQGNLSDLLIGMMKFAGCPLDKLGDGTKALPDLG